MRLTDCQAQSIRQLALQVAGSHARVRLFGSRLDDGARGGDLDLMIELPEPVANPALLAARLSASFPPDAWSQSGRAAHRAQPHAPAHPRHGLQGREIAMILNPKIALRLQFLARVLRFAEILGLTLRFCEILRPDPEIRMTLRFP